MIFRGLSLLLANNMQWNLLKIFLENFRKTLYGFEEVCIAEVLYGKMTKFFTSDFSMNFFYSISWRNGAITIHFKGFWRTSANFRNFRKLPQNRSTDLLMVIHLIIKSIPNVKPLKDITCIFFYCLVGLMVVLLKVKGDTVSSLIYSHA